VVVQEPAAAAVVAVVAVLLLQPQTDIAMFKGVVLSCIWSVFVSVAVDGFIRAC
jgi:hypothetical protein